MPRLKKARAAYKKRDVKESKKAHTKQYIKHSLESHESTGSYVGDFVYGAIDGAVTTFAVVSGVAGASLSANIVIILGVANLFADGISMAVSNYLSAKAENDYIKQERKREEWEVEHYPKGEEEEVRQIYKNKGFKGKDLERAVKIITSNKKVWVDTMMADELKLIEDRTTPTKKGLVTFGAFLLVGAVPLLSYIVSLLFKPLSSLAYTISIGLTLLTFFLIGSARTYVTGGNPLKRGLETFLMGSGAAAVAYGIGFALRGLA